jgi:hypothetical protein
MGTPGMAAESAADREIIARVLGKDIAETLPLSGQLPGTTGQGVLRTEIAMRNLPVVGGGIKADDTAIKDAFTRYLFKQTGTDVGDVVTGPQAFRAMDNTLQSNRDVLESALASRGNVKTTDIADRLLGLKNDLGDMRLPSERAAADAAAAKAFGAESDIANLKLEIAKTTPGSKEHTAATEALRKRLGEAQEYAAKASPKVESSGWADFDRLVEAATRPKELTGADISALRTRANSLFEDVRTGQGIPNKTEKLDALRQFKTTLDNAADRVLQAGSEGRANFRMPAGAPESFAELARQEGMASTLRAARDSAGRGSFSPKAIADELEKTFGPKAAAKEKLPIQQLTGALERQAGGSFASGPEQYKALMAGTLMGQGAFGMLGNAKAALTSPLAVMMLGTKGGRNYMQADPWRASLAKILEQGIAGGGAGQADLFGL